MTFRFTHDGKTYVKHTEVGDGVARVVLEEEALQQEEVSLETSEEVA